jgi:hypothetical protein
MSRAFSLGMPFYALDTPWSTTMAMSQGRTGLYLYDQGVQLYQAPLIQSDLKATGALAVGLSGDRVWRAGVLMDREDTSYGTLTASGTPALPPALLPPTLSNRRLRGVAFTLATQKDAFQSFHDLLGMDTPEDYNFAWNGSVELGVYSRALGSTAKEPFGQLQATNGWSSSPADLTLLTANLSGRFPGTGVENGQANLLLVHYTMLTDAQILAGLVALDVGRRLDPENWYYLGGDQGLRGYPNQLHPGEARWVTSFDYRYLTEQRWWRVVRLGFAAFVDVGAIKQMDGLGWSKTYADAGVGLRLGNLKSSLGRVIVLNIAAPLSKGPYQSKYQFTVGNTMRF